MEEKPVRIYCKHIISRAAKKTLVPVLILLAVNTAFAQEYIITYIKGPVYHNNTLLKLHDRLDGVSELTSTDKTAEIALFNAKKGKFRLSFVNSKPVVKSAAAKNSELYQLMVANYLLTYTTEKTLTARGDFDLREFFGAGSDGKSKNLLLLEGELLPIRSPGLRNNPGDKYFLCTVNGNDTVCNPIRRNNGFLIFDRQLLAGSGFAGKSDNGAVPCFLKRGYTYAGKYTEEILTGPANATFLSTAYLRDMVETFEKGLATYYANDKKKMMADIESQLTYYYGASFEPAANQVLSGLIN